MILYRPVGLQELELIYDGGMKAFPARLPQRPIFYPVLDLEYARQTASDWNVKREQFAGYVTQFKVDDEYLDRFEEHTVGETQYREFWIPAEEIEEFNRHITGHIRVVEAYFADGFQGFVPEKFGMQAKNAVAQFTLLANSFVYNRMDFYLEIKRNHKAVFLNYPFWQKHEFKNLGLKEKVLQAIKEAWQTSFPKIPLPMPAPEQPPDSHPLVKPFHEDAAPPARTGSHPRVKPHQESPPLKQTGPQDLVSPVPEEIIPLRPTDPHGTADPVPQAVPPAGQADSHFRLGLKLGFSGKYDEAIDELTRAVEEAPDQAVAHTSLGVAWHRLGEDDRALACYEAALKLDPRYAEAHYFRAAILYSRGDVREAIAGYTLAIGLEPDLIEAHQRPIPQDRLTEYTRSPAEMVWIAKPAHRILVLNKLLESNPQQASIIKERAARYSRLWNYEQAIADYSACLEIGPDDGDVLHSRGLAYEQIGQFDRALEDYQQAIAIDPQLSDVYINRGVIFGKMGNFRQSIASLTEGIRLAPRNPDGYFNRGMTYFQQGDLGRAIADFSNVIRLSPGDESAYYWRGVSNEEAGRQRQAIADYRQFLGLSQNPGAREEIEQKLSRWNEGERNAVAEAGQKTDTVTKGEPDQNPDLYSLIAALGERALNSIWIASGVDCYGENAEELYAIADQNRPVGGRDLSRITSGIRQTIKGDFAAFDQDAASHWLLIRAWDGSGFYIESNDPKSKERLKSHFQSVEEVEGASPPYESLFIHI